MSCCFDDEPALDAAGLDRSDVVCQSLGGWSGLRFALAHPHRVRRLVLASTMAGVAHAPALAAFAAARELMDERGPASLGLQDVFRATRPDMAYLYDQVSAFNPPMPPEFGAAVFSPDVLVPMDRLAEVRCPVLLIAGARDPIWPPAALAGIADAIPAAEMVVLPDAGHSPYFEQPEAFNAVIKAFLAE
jgi:pimeloyl-ACP methyl ester carboxylesterase